MRRKTKKVLSIICFICVTSLAIACGIFLTIINQDIKNNACQVENIGIGGGGAFFNPMIDPTNPNIFYATCDMGGLYYSHNQGEVWHRTETRSILKNTHIAHNGVVYAGGYGLYASFDKGETLDLIYPKNVVYQISRNGRCSENLMLADDYFDAYVRGIYSNENNLFFITLDWMGQLKLFQMDFTGNSYNVLYSTQIEVKGSYSTEHKIHLIANDNGAYFSIDNKIYFYNLSTNSVNEIYSAKGEIIQLCIIDDYIFFIDETESESLIMYTKDFITFKNLLDKNTLSNSYGSITFNWHFNYLAGNNLNNIFLSLNTKRNEDNIKHQGFLKFNGDSFEWIFDHLFKPKYELALNGWSYGSVGPIFGISAYPGNDNICLMTNIETIYLIEYEKEETKKIKTLHCNDTNSTYTTTGLNVQTTYFVKEDPFNKDHIIICSTDLGLQNSFDGGKTWQRMSLLEGQKSDPVYNTCYDLYFDPYIKGKIYAVWSSRHDAPYNPQPTDCISTRGEFAVSTDGGITWDFDYSKGINDDAIPVKMSIYHTYNKFIIAVATFNRGFFISNDGGLTFTSISQDMDTYYELIFGEDVILQDNLVYCLTAPIQLSSTDWIPSNLYVYNITTNTTSKIDLGEITIARSLTYNKEKGLFINAIPTSYYKNVEGYNQGTYFNNKSGIYHYKNSSFYLYFENYNGIYHSAFTNNGYLYATDPFGKVFIINENGGKVLLDGLFNGLKNISFSLDEKTMYITTLGGGTYRIKNNFKIYRSLIN